MWFLHLLREIQPCERISLFKALWREYKWELNYANMTDSEQKFYDSNALRPDHTG